MVFHSNRKARDVPKKSNRLRRLGERVLVDDGVGMWQAGKVATIIELENGGVAYVVTLRNGSQVWAPANCVNPDPQRPRGADPAAVSGDSTGVAGRGPATAGHARTAGIVERSTVTLSERHAEREERF